MAYINPFTGKPYVGPPATISVPKFPVMPTPPTGAESLNAPTGEWYDWFKKYGSTGIWGTKYPGLEKYKNWTDADWITWRSSPEAQQYYKDNAPIGDPRAITTPILTTPTTQSSLDTKLAPPGSSVSLAGDYVSLQSPKPTTTFPAYNGIRTMMPWKPERDFSRPFPSYTTRRNRF